MEGTKKDTKELISKLYDNVIDESKHNDATNTNRTFNKNPEHVVKSVIFDNAPRIAVLGNVDSGKSTLISVLSRNILDNGRGFARNLTCTHKHELDVGRTSTVSIHPVGFDEEGNIVSVSSAHKKGNETVISLTKRDLWRRVGEKAKKLLFLVDLCGHEKYLKTTCKGLMSHDPHYACVISAANENPSRVVGYDFVKMGKCKGRNKSRNMTRQHLGIVCGMNIPYFIIITKIDITPRDIYIENMKNLGMLLRGRANAEPMIIKTEKDAIKAAYAIMTNKMHMFTKKGEHVCRRIVPVIPMSSVSGVGKNVLVKFLSCIGVYKTSPHSDIYVKHSQFQSIRGSVTEDEQRVVSISSHLPSECNPIKTSTDTVELGIDSVYFKIAGVPVVVTGTVRNGIIYKDQELKLGPDARGVFVPVVVKSIENGYKGTCTAASGQAVGIGIRMKKCLRVTPKKGMYLLSPSVNINPTRFFIAAIRILHHKTTIKRGYVMTINTGPVSRAAKVVKIRKYKTDADTGVVDLFTPDIEHVCTGDLALFVLKFLAQGEIIHQGDNLLIRDSNAKATGKVVYCFNSIYELQRYREYGCDDTFKEFEMHIVTSNDGKGTKHFYGSVNKPKRPDVKYLLKR